MFTTIATVSILADRKSLKRRWRYGLNVFELYVGEVLAHAGISFEWMDDAGQLEFDPPDILIAAAAPESAQEADFLIQYVEKGGVLISYAGLNSLAEQFGFSPGTPHGPGYAVMDRECRHRIPIRYLKANPWVRIGNGNVGVKEWGQRFRDRPGGVLCGAACWEITLGTGTCFRWDIDPIHAIVHMQQGTGPVLDDGIPAPDGTGAVNEGILKADDRMALDWDFDRLKTETGMPYFAYPYADWWRELVIGQILKCALQKEKTLPFVGYWPVGTTAVAVISHDSDGNEDAHAHATLRLLEECQVRSTWCMLEPGYSKEIYREADERGHELAFHYNALEKDNRIWAGEEFSRQLDWLKKAVGTGKIVSNKNHYTRFEGWGELFQWMEHQSIPCDQTRGPSKKGNVGFLFGTCHPYFPIAWADERNRLYDVLEIGFLTQDLDLGHLSDRTVIVPFLNEVLKVSGVAHFLFHQAHLHNSEEVRDAFRLVVSKAKEMSFQFWTSMEVNNWVRLRRNLRIHSIDENFNVQWNGESGGEHAVAWIPLPLSCAIPESYHVESLFGVRCLKITRSKGQQSE